LHEFHYKYNTAIAKPALFENSLLVVVQ